MLAIDTETSGLDLKHGCGPFFVTCAHEGEPAWFYEWDADPLTRKVTPDPADVKEIDKAVRLAANWCKDTAPEVQERHALVLHNAKFDVRALANVGVTDWPWFATRDTLIAAHLLNSARPKDLTSLATWYLKINIKGREDALEKAVQDCRRKCRRHLPDWKIADEGLESMPSSEGKSIWRSDYWLPRAWVKHQWETSEAAPEWRDNQVVSTGPGVYSSSLEGWEFRPPRTAGEDDKGHPYWTVLSDYATADSEMTVGCWQVMSQELKCRGLWAIYLERMKLLPVIHQMEDRGVTYLGSKMDEAAVQIQQEHDSAEAACLAVAESRGFPLVLAKGAAVNGSMREFIFDVLKLPVVKETEKGSPSLDEEAFDAWGDLLKPHSDELLFIRSLQKKRGRGKLLTDVSGYKKFRFPTDQEGVYTLHPDINPTGSATLRYSFKKPNTANVAKGDDTDEFTMRHVFGPRRGRVWVSMDYENIELRIPAYESGERCMIELFEKPDDPPYFGSYHLMNASIIYPDLFGPLASEKGVFKKKYGATWYQWTKNFGFAFQYGAGRGKCDRTAKRPGSYAKVKDRLKEHTKLANKYIDQANKYGYVETIPDRTVDPSRGYPLVCTRADFGRVKPTLPLNYHVQSTAMWCTSKAMVRCAEWLDRWTLEGGLRDRDRYRITLQIHDELVFDMPEQPSEEIARKVGVLRRLMVKSGEDIGIPLKVSATLHTEHWGAGEVVQDSEEVAREPVPA